MLNNYLYDFLSHAYITKLMIKIDKRKQIRNKIFLKINHGAHSDIKSKIYSNSLNNREFS